MDRRPGARSRGSEVRPEDDVRVEDSKERIEVTVAGRGEEGIDGSSLLRQVAIRLRRQPNSATGPAGSLLFALVIAPALATLVRSAPGLDYRTYLAIGTAGLLVPLACMFAGLGVVVDRQIGARRELLTAPIPRGLIVLGNLVVAVLVSGLQLGALLLATYLRGAHFNATATGIGWFVGAAGCYGLLDRRGAGLRDIWGMANTTVMATLSTAVVMAYAVLFLALALRVFRRAAVR
jgi:hypothetical protein